MLEGFEKVFDALDEIIRIIRKSDGKADAAEKIMTRFELDAEQTDAILELKIYRLARLEILVIRKELEEKRKRARQIAALLKRRREPLDAGPRASSKRSRRRTATQADSARTIESDTDEPEYSADDFIVEEDNVVIVSRDGWVKRQKEVKDIATTRLREGDAVLAVAAGSTRATCVFFTQLRRRLHVPHHRRAGVDRLRRADPAALQAEGRREDRRRAQPRPARRRATSRRSKEGRRRRRRCTRVAVTSDGYSLRFGLEPFVEPSTRAGRRFARPADGAEVVGVAQSHRRGDPDRRHRRRPRPAVQGSTRSTSCPGPGKGVILIKLGDDDRVLGFIASTGDRDLLTVETTRGAEQTISTAKYEVTGRGGKGRELLQRGQFTRVLRPTPERRCPARVSQARQSTSRTPERMSAARDA